MQEHYTYTFSFIASDLRLTFVAGRNLVVLLDLIYQVVTMAQVTNNALGKG